MTWFTAPWGCRFDELLALGKKLLSSPKGTAEVRERMKQLSQDRAALKEDWDRRNKQLKQWLDLQVCVVCV